MKKTSRNHFKAAGGGAIYSNTLGVVLVIYLDEIISACDEFHYRPCSEFCHFSSMLHATTVESSSFALSASIIGILLINY